MVRAGAARPERMGPRRARHGRALESSGVERFAGIAAAWRELAARGVGGPIDGAPVRDWWRWEGSRSLADGGDSSPWRGFAASSLVLPELSFARMAGASWLTVNLDVAPDDTVEGLELRVERRLRGSMSASCRSSIQLRRAPMRCSARCRRPISRQRWLAGRGEDPSRASSEGRTGARGRGACAD